MKLQMELFGKLMNLDFLVPCLALMALGLGQYYYRKSIAPISQSTIDELSDKSFLGTEGLQYSPRGGLIVFFFGVLFFVIFAIVNFSSAPNAAYLKAEQEALKSIQNSK